MDICLRDAERRECSVPRGAWDGGQFTSRLVHAVIAAGFGEEGVTTANFADEGVPLVVGVAVEDGFRIGRSDVPVPSGKLPLELSGRPACAAGEDFVLRSDGGGGSDDFFKDVSICADEKAGEDGEFSPRLFDGIVKEEEGCGFDGATEVDGGVGFREVEVAGERGADFDIGRSVENEAHGSGVVVFDDEHNGAEEVGIFEFAASNEVLTPEAFRHDERTAFTQRMNFGSPRTANEMR